MTRWLAAACMLALGACGSRNLEVLFHVRKQVCPTVGCADAGCPLGGVKSIRVSITRRDTGESVIDADAGCVAAPKLCGYEGLESFEFARGLTAQDGLAVKLEGNWGTRCEDVLYFSCASVGPVDLSKAAGVDLYCNSCSPLYCPAR